MERILRHLLTAPVDGAEVPDLGAWWRRHHDRAAGFDRPVDRALAAGLSMDRLGWAFASGYQEALRQLVPALPPKARVALCATEEGGNHPRAIEARLEPADGAFRLSGAKKFTTLGTHADLLLVVASEGETAEGRKRLAVACVPADRSGVHVEAMAELPFVPEIAHATTRFDAVPVAPEERLPGDGYTRYLKPFRTVEDVHVHAATVGWLLGTGRRFGWPDDALSELASAAVTLRALAAAPPLDEAVHVALAGAMAATARTVASVEACWAQVDEPTRARWQRDRALLGVAGSAREKRLAAAWARLRAAG